MNIRRLGCRAMRAVSRIAKNVLPQRRPAITTRNRAELAATSD